MWRVPSNPLNDLRVVSCALSGLLLVPGGAAMAYVHWQVANHSGEDLRAGAWLCLLIAFCAVVSVVSIVGTSTQREAPRLMWLWIGLGAQLVGFFSGLVGSPLVLFLVVPIGAINVLALCSRPSGLSLSGCPQCGYDLAGLRGDRCPECGTCVDVPSRGKAAFQPGSRASTAVGDLNPD